MLFTKDLFRRLPPYFGLVSFLLLASLYLAYRIHNIWVFNPYWGYDGGGHIGYIYSLAETFRFPLVEKNYIAWHEPFYYILSTPVLMLAKVFTTDIGLQLKTLGLVQVFWSTLALFLVYKISLSLLPRRYALVTAVLFSALPAFHQVSTFLTNELFSYLFAFLLTFLFIQRLQQGRFRPWDGWLFGIIIGLGTISKITVIIPATIMLFACTLLWWKRFPGVRSAFFASLFFTTVLINLPWQIYRYQHISAGPSLNVQSFVKAAPLPFRQALKTFTTFDRAIFDKPYWPVGTARIPSMFYADLVMDYYGSMENDELLDATPKNQLFQTANTAWITKRSAWFGHRLIWLGIPLVILLFFGTINMLREFFGGTFTTRMISLYAFLCMLGYGAAQAYYAYRYPYFDMGMVKSMFILPGIFFPLWFGIHFLRQRMQSGGTMRTLAIGYFCLLAAYLAMSYAGYYLVRFNY